MKTPAPKVLDQAQKDYFTKLIEANPPTAKLQGIISDVKDKFPRDFDNVNPIPLNQLSETAQKARSKFIRAAKELNKSDTNTMGKTVVTASPCKDTTLDKMSSKLGNFFNKVTVPNASLNLPNEIKNAAASLSGSMMGFVNKMSGALNDEIMGQITQAVDAVSAKEFAKVSDTFPTTAAMKSIKEIQERLIGNSAPVDAAGNLLPPIPSKLEPLGAALECLAPNISAKLNDTMNDLLSAALKNTTNVPACAVEEIMGAANYKMINDMDEIIAPLLEPISSVLDFEFDTKSFLGGGVDLFKKLDTVSKCAGAIGSGGGGGGAGGATGKCPPSTKIKIGVGAMPSPSQLQDQMSFDRIFSGTAISQAATDLSSDFEKTYGAWNVFGSPLAEASTLGPCYTGPITICSCMVSIIGGGGSGATGEVLLGRFIDKIDVDDPYAGVKRTASIVGVNITKSGSGYTSEPLVYFEDNCDQGYGAFGRATIDQNVNSPTYGQVTSITMTSTGVNYPAEVDEEPLYVKGVVIVNPGSGYTEDDTLENFEICGVDSNGGITCLNVVNPISYDDLPDLNINSETGVGAILRPIMSKFRPPQGEVIDVIDCVGKL